MELRKFLVFLLLASLIAGISATNVSASMKSWYEVSGDYAKEAYNQIAGSNGENVISSGPEYDRVKAIATKLGITRNVYLIDNNEVNAAASCDELFVLFGLVRACPLDDQLAGAMAFTYGHIAKGDIEGKYCAIKSANDAAESAMKTMAGKPGGKENVQIMKNITGYLPAFTELTCSQGQVYGADLFGFELCLTSGYDKDKVLSVFDLPDFRNFQPRGIFATLSSCPPADKRVSNIIKNLAQIEKRASDAKASEADKMARWHIIESNLDKCTTVKPEAYIPVTLGKPIPGYCYTACGPKCLFWVLANVEDGKIQIDKRGAITLPSGTTEVVVFFNNPKPANYMICVAILLPSDKEKFANNQSTGREVEPAEAIMIPVDIALATNPLRLHGLYFSGNSSKGKASDRSYDLTFALTK